MNPDVRVAVVQYRPVYVTGQVNRPGAYPYTAGLTVEKTLALAGQQRRDRERRIRRGAARLIRCTAGHPWAGPAHGLLPL